MQMEAKDKAKELVEKFMYELMFITNIADRFPIAKACAIICVDEIIKIASSVRHYGDMQLTEYGFWQQVKEEISKL